MKTLTLFVCSLIVTGCSVKPTLTHDGERYLYSPINTSKCHSGKADASVQIGFVGDSSESALMFKYYGSRWAFLDPERGLELTVDGVTQIISGTEKHRETRSGMVQEELYFPISKVTVEKIAVANEVKLKTFGTKGYIERCLSSEQLNQIVGVVAYVK